MTVNLPKPEVILTHESDLDGFLSGILLQRLAKKLFGYDVRLEAYHYQAWKQRELRENAAWVTDFSFEARLDKANWLIIDHHPTEAAAQQAQLIHDVKKSAGTLCYELCREHGIQSAALDRLVQLNNISDLFLEDDPEFVIAGDYANLVKTYNFWNLHAVIDGNLERLLDHPLLEVMAVKRRIEDPIGFEWSRRNVVELSPTIGFVDTIVGNTNLIIHQLLDSRATKYPVLITLFKKANSQVIVSLRSRNGEAAGVAAQLHGGGHPNASGAVLPRSVRNVEDAIEYLRRVLNPSSAPMPLNAMGGLLASFKVKD
jgi:oligoribonuclease NrnB/cAMP/cGMP phosphodiesterase (DHH superfamily)